MPLPTSGRGRISKNLFYFNEHKTPKRRFVRITDKGLEDFPMVAPTPMNSQQNEAGPSSAAADPAEPLTELNHTDFGAFMDLNDHPAKRARGSTTGTVGTLHGILSILLISGGLKDASRIHASVVTISRQILESLARPGGTGTGDTRLCRLRRPTQSLEMYRLRGPCHAVHELLQKATQTRLSAPRGEVELCDCKSQCGIGRRRGRWRTGFGRLGA